MGHSEYDPAAKDRGLALWLAAEKSERRMRTWVSRLAFMNWVTLKSAATLISGARLRRAQPVTKGFSRARLTEAGPPAARIMSMRARSAVGTCR